MSSKQNTALSSRVAAVIPRPIVILLLACLAAATFVVNSFAEAPLVAAGEDSVNTVVHTVEIRELVFVPASIKVKPGDTVTWVNRDIVPHTASAIDGSWNTGLIARNETKSIVITSDTATLYFCQYHPSMQAQLKFP